MTRTILCLGNGPSLKGFNLHELKMPTIGMNSAYRYWREIDWRPTYYACLDTVVGMSHAEAIKELADEGRIEKFLLRDNLCAEIGPHPRVINYDQLRSADARLVIDPITTGSHSVLWAAYMGYQVIGLAGIDVNYVEILKEAKRLEGNELVITETPKENPNYFFASYQQAGDKYNVPNPNPGLHGRAWNKVRDALPQFGSRAVNIAFSSPFVLFRRMDREEFRILSEAHLPRYGIEAPEPVGETIDWKDVPLPDGAVHG